MNTRGEISIRLAGAEDIDAIVLLDRSLDTLPHWPVVEYRAAIDSQERCIFVAEFGDEVFGLAVGRAACIAGECSGELESVGVSALAQRRGIGRELCGHVIEWCQAQGALHLDLEVRSQSAGAVALYEKLGFVVAGKRRGYYGNPADDAILMRLDLKRELPEPAQPIP